LKANMKNENKKRENCTWAVSHLLGPVTPVQASARPLALTGGPTGQSPARAARTKPAPTLWAQVVSDHWDA
jgi:hypothetical protein